MASSSSSDSVAAAAAPVVSASSPSSSSPPPPANNTGGESTGTVDTSRRASLMLDVSSFRTGSSSAGNNQKAASAAAAAAAAATEDDNNEVSLPTFDSVRTMGDLHDHGVKLKQLGLKPSASVSYKEHVDAFAALSGFENAERALTMAGRAAVDDLVAGGKNEHWRVRQSVLPFLEKLASSSFAELPPNIQQGERDDEDDEEGKKALSPHHVAALKVTSKCVDGIVFSVRDPHENVRDQAISTLGCVLGPAAMRKVDVHAMLADRLRRDPSIQVRRTAAYVLGAAVPPSSASAMSALDAVICAETGRNPKPIVTEAVEQAKADAAAAWAAERTRRNAQNPRGAAYVSGNAPTLTESQLRGDGVGQVHRGLSPIKGAAARAQVVPCGDPTLLSSCRWALELHEKAFQKEQKARKKKKKKRTKGGSSASKQTSRGR